ncbi:HAUS augmin-like complex subunit 8 [Lacerta agilis]|uniref:HAUS augmin-like complex subunit 8 n=1 Tax=Lacerta agilis TaxID=80427 RepID=UPI001419211F|nr:HAUS augmin-like complex subunit 8 [Lacerta agilis]
MAASSPSPFQSGASLRAEPGLASEEKAGAWPKQRGGRIVPARYLDYQKGSGKAAAKATADPHEVLQSTLVESHGRSRPELELSAIKSKSCPRTSKATPREKQSEVSPDSDDLIRMLESETLLLTYASLKMEKNTAFLEEQAERNLLTLSREAARLQADAQKKRHRLQRLKKDRQLSESLDRQLEVLGPVCEQIRAFEEEYRHFATALDTARHELPVNEIYLGGDKSQYLDDLQRALAATQEALRRALPEHAKENAKGLSVAKELEETSLEVAAELPRTVAHVLDLSADVGKEASLRCQKVFEDTQGVEKMKQLYFG